MDIYPGACDGTDGSILDCDGNGNCLNDADGDGVCNEAKRRLYRSGPVTSVTYRHGQQPLHLRSGCGDGITNPDCDGNCYNDGR